jgi:hypothetical protein
MPYGIYKHHPNQGFQKGNKLGFKKKYPSYNKGLPSEQQGHWKGGKIIDNGYILIKNNNHPFCNNKGYIQEHRLVMEKHIGRFLKPQERVHHKGIKYPIGSIENKQDNKIENLQLFANESEHQSIPHHGGNFIYKGRKNEYYREYYKTHNGKEYARKYRKTHDRKQYYREYYRKHNMIEYYRNYKKSHPKLTCEQ